jgi:hypothetical protein
MSTQRPVLVSQSCADVQHELQPQRRRPVPQRLTHVPLAQTWPHMQPPGHDAGAQK